MKKSETPMNDRRNLPVGTTSQAALDLHERALWHLVSFYGDPMAAFDATIAADPGWGFARIAPAVFILTLTEPAMLPQAHALLAQAAPLMHDAPAHERGHFAAAQAAAAGRWREACARWDALLFGRFGYEWAAATGVGHDHEGLVSTLGALATALLGLRAGHFLRRGETYKLLALGLGSALLGWLWAGWLPLNKPPMFRALNALNLAW